MREEKVCNRKRSTLFQSFQQDSASRTLVSALALSETMFIEPWRVTMAAVAKYARTLRRRRGSCQVSPMSDEWLRWQEIDSYKHPRNP